MAALAYLSIGGPGRLLSDTANATVASAHISAPLEIALTLVLSAVVFAAACSLFSQRDLDLSGD
jgi:hypothetical protein